MTHKPHAFPHPWILKIVMQLGGSGKRSLPMASWMQPSTIGKLRRLRSPLPPGGASVLSAVHGMRES